MSRKAAKHWNVAKELEERERHFVLRVQVLVLEIVFVGQCEVFVCFDFVDFFSLGRKAHSSTNGVSI